jgi:septal ring factor EnvC (AmiA/AmiB activator)
VDEQPAEASSPSQGDLRALENSLKGLWERARRAAELITELRGENKDLRAQVAALEAELERLRQDLGRKDQLIKKAMSEVGVSPPRGAVVMNGEREAIVARVKDLLSRLESYL